MWVAYKQFIYNGINLWKIFLFYSSTLIYHKIHHFSFYFGEFVSGLLSNILLSFMNLFDFKGLSVFPLEYFPLYLWKQNKSVFHLTNQQFLLIYNNKILLKKELSNKNKKNDMDCDFLQKPQHNHFFYFIHLINKIILKYKY